MTGDDYAIVSPSTRAFERTRVLSQAETFGVFDPRGDSVPGGEMGLFHEGTRFLSRLELRVEGLRPILLSSTVKETNDLLAVDLTNPEFQSRLGALVPRGTVHVFRSRFLWREACHEEYRVTNHGLEPVELRLELWFEADFADLFEVRGMRRLRRGAVLPSRVTTSEVDLRYRGLDDVVRRTRLQFDPAPAQLDAEHVAFDFRLEPQERRVFHASIACEIGERTVASGPFAEELRALAGWLKQLPPRTIVRTDNEQFEQWIARSVADLKMMTAETKWGIYPYAGIPWFNTIFGRDGIITALQLLWLDPRPARGVLASLAAMQARHRRPEQDAEPGKILHETRRGEMAALHEIPFGQYYGTVDATPLYVFLAGEYWTRTGDRAFIETIWDSIERALGWIEGPGDADGDGFVEYARQTPQGLLQQGWKDSGDSIFHADGTLAEPPIALCEVQAYAYGAYRAAERLAHALGRHDQALDLGRRAAALRRRFDAAFWSEELGSYALALDGAKRPCLVRASNAGHCLLTGIARSDRAQRVAVTLCEPRSFSGWGVRTLAAGERRYNPMAYHNGTVWPHDNALIARGFARYGLTRYVPLLLNGLFAASQFFDLRRMPELFCGFERRTAEGPTLYPAACAPQSWAAGALFLLVEAALGLRIDALRRRVVLSHPVLPETIGRMTIEGLEVGEARVDLVLERHAGTVTAYASQRHGSVEIVLVE